MSTGSVFVSTGAVEGPRALLGWLGPRTDTVLAEVRKALEPGG